MDTGHSVTWYYPDNKQDIFRIFQFMFCSSRKFLGWEVLLPHTGRECVSRDFGSNKLYLYIGPLTVSVSGCDVNPAWTLNTLTETWVQCETENKGHVKSVFISNNAFILQYRNTKQVNSSCFSFLQSLQKTETYFSPNSSGKHKLTGHFSTGTNTEQFCLVYGYVLFCVVVVIILDCFRCKN